MIQRRVNGGDNPQLVECLNEVIPIYAVRWDVQANNGVFGSSKQGTNYMEAQLWHKPALQECKDIILAWKNTEIDRQILSGFTWNDMPVWLSSENQFNYKAAFDLAVQTDGATLPVTFKFGTTEEPQYHEFTTVAELTDFYTQAMAHVNTVLKAGWMEKDNFDWSPYGGQSMLDTITDECAEEAILDQTESSETTDNA